MDESSPDGEDQDPKHLDGLLISGAGELGESWQESVVAEETRVRFLKRYMELRPGATLQRFGVYEALQFALRAMAFMWAQSSGWERIAETMLVMGFERLKSRLPE